MRCPECIKCGALTEKSVTTSITDLDSCLVIVHNVPCYKCTECNEILFTGDVVEKIEKLEKSLKLNEISVVGYLRMKKKSF